MDGHAHVTPRDTTTPHPIGAQDDSGDQDVAIDDNGRTQRRTFLLVEDDEPLRSRMARALTSRGFLVLQASTSESALSLARHVAVQFAVVDVHLGKESGIQLVRELTCIVPSMTIVVCSGDLSANVAQAARVAGAVAVLAKPVALDDILGALPATAEGPCRRSR